MSGVTCSTRLPVSKGLNSDFRKMASNLVPFPRLHFLMTGYAPLSVRTPSSYTKYSVPEITGQMFNARNMLCAADPLHGRYLSAAAMFRGHDFNKPQYYLPTLDKLSPQFVEWVPNNLKIGVCELPLPGPKKLSATSIANSTAIQEVFRRLTG